MQASLLRTLPTWEAVGMLTLLVFLTGSGCSYLVPKHKVAALERQYHAMEEENQALQGALQNTKVALNESTQKTGQLEQQVAQAQESLKLAAGLHPSSGNASLRQMAEQYPGLVYDEEAGVARLGADILFEPGGVGLRPRAQELLDEFSNFLQSSEGQGLRLLVVGHTDNEPITKKPAREVFPDNLYLGAERALAVSDFLQKSGVEPERLGVLSYGQHQPLQPNDTLVDRRANRRVEIFVVDHNVPLVGWRSLRSQLR